MATHIHPTAQIGPDVECDVDVVVGPFSCVQGKVRVHAGAVIGAHVLVGGYPKIKGYGGNLGSVEIGPGTFISEFCAIDAATGAATSIGAGAYLMPHCYVGHDSTLERDVVLTAGCKLGGHTWIGRGANLGLGSVVHQFSAVGALAMIGMGSVVAGDVPPFAKVKGNPARVSGVNLVGLKRSGFEPERCTAIAAALEQWLDTGGPWPLDVGRMEFEAFRARSRRSTVRRVR